VNTEQSRNQREALPLLVEMELATHCDKCGAARSMLAEMVRQAKGLTLELTGWERESEHKKTVNSGSLDSLSLHCATCKDSGVVPTEKGWRLIGLAKLFWESASTRDLGKQPEIPW